MHAYHITYVWLSVALWKPLSLSLSLSKPLLGRPVVSLATTQLFCVWGLSVLRELWHSESPGTLLQR